MADSKNCERNVIKLENSMAITFTQEWFNKTHLKDIYIKNIRSKIAIENE
ncbi:MAG: hypothetical protein ACFFB0_13515 [Promethearchaeota archaeon]